jgi:hypothetical protein
MAVERLDEPITLGAWCWDEIRTAQRQLERSEGNLLADVLREEPIVTERRRVTNTPNTEAELFQWALEW